MQRMKKRGLSEATALDMKFVMMGQAREDTKWLNALAR